MHTENGAPATATPGEEPDTREAIQHLAYEISLSEDAGSPEENWERAERELDSGT